MKPVHVQTCLMQCKRNQGRHGVQGVSLNISPSTGKIGAGLQEASLSSVTSSYDRCYVTHFNCLANRVSYKAVEWELEMFSVEHCVYLRYLTNSTPRREKKCRE